MPVIDCRWRYQQAVLLHLLDLPVEWLMENILVALQLCQQLSRGIALPEHALKTRRLMEMLHRIILTTNHRPAIGLNEVADIGWYDELLHPALIHNVILILIPR